MKKTIGRTLSAILAVCMLFCGVLTTTSGATEARQPNNEIGIDDGIGIRASSNISAWSPLLSRSLYGAQVSFTGTRSGSIRVELQNSSGGVISSFTESFTNRNSIVLTRNRTTSPGTYRIVIRLTINGSTEVRTSSFMNLS